MPILLIVIGFALLLGGAELLVRGAAALAKRFGVSPLVVGLTVVAFGTSSPEVAVSLGAAINGQPDIAVGNVVGSNIFNVLFILGISALVTPLVVAQKLIRADVPIMIGASALVWLLALDGALGRLDGALLFAGIIIYTVAAIRVSRRESAEIQSEYEQGVPKPMRAIPAAILIVLGLTLCVLGSRLLVQGSVRIAELLGVSQLVIGLTIVAAGTSLPELATSLVAALRGQRDIAVGNVIGSNIFNILAILGLVGIVSPRPIAVSSAALAFDIPVMFAVALVCLPIVFTGSRVARWEGALFLLFYCAYVIYLVLAATNHDALAIYAPVMLWFVLPIAGLGILASLITSLLARNAARRNTGQTHSG